MYPSLNFDSYAPVLHSDIKGIILRGFGAGHLPTGNPDWFKFLKMAKELERMVFISSHSRHGGVNLDLYESGRKAKE
ncbi:MAG: hypothetical protein P8X42_03910 [Calditrichaceae bacterium]